jgi:TonB family protein
MLRLFAAPLIVAALSPSIATAAENGRTAAIADFASCAKPEWPKESLRKEQTGKVVLSFLIGADGTVNDARVVNSSGYPLLDEAARDGIRKCRFKPVTVNGVPQEGWQMMQYVWTLTPQVSLQQTPRLPSPYLAPALAGDRDALFALAQEYGKGTPNEITDVNRMLQALTVSTAAAQFELATRLYQGRGAPLNRSESLLWYRQSANAGFAAAQERIGAFLDYGTMGQQRDSKTAMEWYLKAAAQGNHDAENALGVMYHNGREVPRDYTKAAEWYLKAVEGSNTWAQANLGRLYMRGQGVEKNPAEALRLLHLAADKNNHAAELDLALMYFNGFGVDADDTTALRFLRRAATGGDQSAQVRLAGALNYGVRMPANYSEAVEWLRKVADRGNPTGLNNLGYAYEIGRGVERNYATARGLYLQAVAKENSNAEAALGGLYEQGQGGTQDLNKAVELYQSAIRHNNADGMVRMAKLQESGQGVAQNVAEARALYERAAELNNAAAMRRLAQAYRNAELGLEADAAKADEWQQKAAERSARQTNPFQI